MIRNNNFILCEVAGSQVLVPVGEAVGAFAGIVNLNGSGVYLWHTLEAEQTLEMLASALLEKYDVSPEQAKADAESFVVKLRSVGAIQE